MLNLPQRQGEPPKTHFGLPHEQLSQNPPADIYTQLKAQVFDFEFVKRRPSVISVPGAEALWLLEEGGHSCAGAFMRGNEFAPVHPPYDGSLHMVLPADDVPEFLESGWGEIHPLVSVGSVPPGFVLVFGPRDNEELGVILGLIDTSYRFARGIWWSSSCSIKCRHRTMPPELQIGRQTTRERQSPRCQPHQAQMASPIINRLSSSLSQDSSSVNIEMHSRQVHGIFVKSVPQNVRSGPKAS